MFWKLREIRNIGVLHVLKSQRNTQYWFTTCFGSLEKYAILVYYMFWKLREIRNIGVLHVLEA